MKQKAVEGGWKKSKSKQASKTHFLSILREELLWNEEIKVECCWSSDRIIHCSILNLQGLKIGDFLACYGTPYLAEKMSFWEILQNLVDSIKGPWIIIGDLKEIISGCEKTKGRHIWRMKLFCGSLCRLLAV